MGKNPEFHRIIIGALRTYGPLTSEEVLQAIHNMRGTKTGKRYKYLPTDMQVIQILSSDPGIEKKDYRGKHAVWGLVE